MRYLVYYATLLYLATNSIAGAENIKQDIKEASDKPLSPPSVADEVSTKTDFIVDNNEVVIGITLRERLPISDGMLAYLLNNDIALPLEQLMLLLEFPIQLVSGSSKAAGWFIAENRRFELDTKAGIATVNGKQYRFDPTAVSQIDNELFVPTKLLSQWFPIDFQANLRALNVNLIPREPIAIDDRLKRRKGHKKFGGTYIQTSRNKEWNTPYELVTPPALAVNLGIGNSSTGGFLGNYTVRAYGDLAYMNNQLSVFGNQEGITDARMTLSRRDPRGRLLGSLDATEIELGDIGVRSVPLIANGTSGRGIHIARRLAGHVGGLETITLEGALEPGYDVELYRNNILINAIQASNEGNYKFADLKLFSGENVYRLEFYGPQGQRRSESKRYTVGAGQLKTGQFSYDIGLSQPEKTLFGLKNTSTNNTNNNDNDLAASAIFDYGLSSTVTARGGISYYPSNTSDDARTYAVAGLSSQLGIFYSTLDTAFDDQGGIAIGLSAKTKLDSLNLAITHESYLNDFTSNKNFDLEKDTSNALKSQTSINIDTLFDKIVKGGSIGIDLELNRTELNDGRLIYDVGSQLKLQKRNVSFSTDVDYSYTPATKTEKLLGASRFNIGFDKTSLRLDTNYTINPISELKDFGATLSRKFFDEYSTSLSYREDYLSDNKTISSNIAKDFGDFDLSLSVSQNSGSKIDDNTTVFLNAAFGMFGRSKIGKRTLFNKKGSGSAVQAQAFLDEDQDGIRDPNEQALSGIQFVGSGKRATSGKDGTALLQGSSTGGWTDIFMDPDSFSEPRWRSGKSGVAVLPRPGVVSKVELAIIITADIEGTVVLSKGADDETKPLGNIGVEVVRTSPIDGKTEVIAQAITSYDGLYTIDGIPVGNVTLRIKPDQAARLAVTGELAKSITLNKETDLLIDQNFTLVREPRNTL